MINLYRRSRCVDNLYHELAVLLSLTIFLISLDNFESEFPQ